MKRQERWRKVLETEMLRWSALPYDELVSRLGEIDVYVVEMDSREYQVEVELLEKPANHVHVVVSVDDGSLPASLFPATDGFTVERSIPKG